MNAITNITVNLSEQDIKEIIANYVRHELPNAHVTAEDVNLNIISQEIGPQFNPYTVYRLKDVTVKCKMEG